MDGKLKGRVLWFNGTKGYGEICDESGNRAFFMQKDCDGCFPGLFADGQRVEFLESKETLFGKTRVTAISTLDKKQSKSKPSRTRRDEASI